MTTELLLKIFNVGGIEDTHLTFNPGVNLLVGKNESGKTSILNAMRYINCNGLFPKGSRKIGSPESFIELNGSKIDSKGKVISRNSDSIREFLCNHELENMVATYIMLCDPNFIMNFENNKLELSCPLDLIKFINLKQKDLCTPKCHLSLDEAIRTANITTYRLIRMYLEKQLLEVSEKFNIAHDTVKQELDVKRYVGDQIANMPELNEVASWDQYANDISNIANAAIANGKKPSLIKSEEIDLDKQKIAAQLYYKVIEKVESEFNIKNGKPIGENGLDWTYLSTGNKYYQIALMKHRIIQNYPKEKLVILDDFEVLSRDRGNKLITLFHKYGLENGTYILIAMARTQEELLRNKTGDSKFPFPVYLVNEGVAERL